MTRPKMPPTPASSTEIKGQDHSNKLSSLQLTFELPPSAITPPEMSKSTGPGTKMSPISPTSTLPYLQPSETVKARRRSTTAQQKETFALPPPPTRSRKIIQMKPRPQEEQVVLPSPSPKGSSNHAKHAPGSGATAGSKTTTGGKKQPSATSAAGRKIARKTAHSLIERRRRSKMNEEFAVLKGLIPACTGEMHKLAILQASIEYVRYLEDCIMKLKAQHGQESMTAATTPAEFRPAQRDEEGDWNAKPATDVDEDGPEDIEMTDSETPSPAFTPVVGPRTTTSTRSSYSSISPVPQRHLSSASSAEYQLYSSSSNNNTNNTHTHNHNHSVASAGTSPHQYPYPATSSTSHSALTSPALRPQLEIDHEVSAALLMLGAGRTNAGPGPARGMSVRDLLSS
ncbi:hypothetical protein GGR55DRAFT_407907 [Xylaria sp. FL0064]|nr:hypothetical protein GGR55DRAFT_407907 [Xylaria sp. FL0064]